MNKLFLFVCVVMLSGASIAQIKADYDKDTNFESYQTYKIIGWEKDSDKVLTPFDKERILNSIDAELSDRGLAKVDSNADIEITLFIVVEQKTSKTAYTTFNGGYGYRGRWGWGYGGMGSASTSYSEEDYLEGTFVLDMYNSGNLVWQGVITDEVKDNPEKREKTIPKKMKKLMKKFPVKPKK